LLAPLERDATGVRGEPDVRRHIDLAVGRALVEPRFAARLLADPTVALDDTGCSPQQHLQLRGIRAATVKDFAHQAQALFWPSRQPTTGTEDRDVPLAMAL
jgi:hypothetical protein